MKKTTKALYTLIIFTGLTGFYFLYHTSQKMKTERSNALSQWISKHPKNAKAIGIFLLLISIVSMVIKEGLGVGLFTSILLLMCGASLLITLSPLRMLKKTHVIAFLALSLVLETLILN